MSDDPAQTSSHQGEEDESLEDAAAANHVVPAFKSVKQIHELDAEDESLANYKKTLMGAGAGDAVEPAFPNDSRNVIMKKLAIVIDGKEDVEIELMGDLSNLKDNPVLIPEGTKYKVKLYFYVQREIVLALRYVMTMHRKGIRVNKENVMVGSYPPKTDVQSWVSQVEEAPSGMLARGTYIVKSLFTDDDKNEFLSWEWAIKIDKK